VSVFAGDPVPVINEAIMLIALSKAVIHMAVLSTAGSGLAAGQRWP
jgi:hypothetical protein